LPPEGGEISVVLSVSVKYVKREKNDTNFNKTVELHTYI
jgi:hypothetical protein